MKGYTSETIRNIALVGHGNTGKTTFLEAALLTTGVITRMGKTEDGNTTSDFDKIEIEKKFSISATPVPVEFEGMKLNFIDAPGYIDFIGDVHSALRGAEAAAIFVDASAGSQLGTERGWAVCNTFQKPRFFVINKIDKDNVDIDAVIKGLKAEFGPSVVDWDNKDEMNEAIAGLDDELMEKFFGGEEFTEEEFKNGLAKGIASCEIAPVLKCSATTGAGVLDVLKAMTKIAPKFVPDEGNDPLAFVFKTCSDPFLGKISLAKVRRGTLTPGMTMYNSRSEKEEKLGSMFFMRGKNQLECTSASAGDIVAIGKLANTLTCDTLTIKGDDTKKFPIPFPQPTYFTALESKDKGDETKFATGLKRLMEEDPSFSFERNHETHQSLLGTQGDIHTAILIAKLKEKFGCEVNIVPTKIGYRETIKGTADVQGKHKKQSGGAGQYGDVWIKFEPSTEEFEFVEDLFGGSVPKQYVPAVEKGLRDCMEKGPLAGCKCQNIKATLHDGSYHEVDSDEMSFKMAASLAFKKGIAEAKPCLLEPIMHIEIIIPGDYAGDVMGDMNKRRGIILGMEPLMGGQVKILAEVPQMEVTDYTIVLRAMTHARSSFTIQFDRYAELPGMLAEKVIAEYKASQAE
ncbi:MAG: elongation factor G [Clostridia bacterium]|nr:elongation factor G [Clostridia bacterium]